MSNIVCRRESEKGAGSTEYAGVVLVSIILVLAIIISVYALGIGTKLTCQISKIFGGTCSTDTSKEKSWKPDAKENVVSNREEKYSAKGAAHIPAPVKGVEAKVNVGLEDGAGVTTEKYQDGSGSIKLSDSKELTVGASVEAEAGKGAAEASAELNLAGGANYTRSENRKCDTKSGEGSSRSCSGFKEKYQKQLENRKKQGVSQAFAGDTNIDDRPDEIEESVAGKIELKGSAKGKASKGDAEISLAAEGNLSGTANRTWTHNTNDKGEKKDLQKTTTSFKYAGEASGSVVVDLSEQELKETGFSPKLGASGALGWGLEMSYEEDAKGNVTKMTFKTNTYEEGGGKAKAGNDRANGDATSRAGHEYETTVSIDLNSLSPADRKVMEDYAHSANSASPVFPSSVWNPSKPVDSKDRLNSVIHDNAQVTTTSYSTQRTSAEGTLDLWVASYTQSASTAERKMEHQSYLGAPGADGTRKYSRNDTSK
ncbi:MULTISPECIES: hypothetical protein [Actinomyces]|uniref:hypothetical protein n=1 Tax=Actinomyces TaxID=1654 RepID=UPI000AB0F522|nr:hypothetical protein [Actinomyces oris]